MTLFFKTFFQDAISDGNFAQVRRRADELTRKIEGGRQEDAASPVKEEPTNDTLQPGQDNPADAKGKAAAQKDQKADKAVQKGDEGRGQEDFVTAPGGSIDFGEITKEVEEASEGRHPAAPIRLQKGSKDTFGHEHISQGRIEQFKEAGYTDEIDALQDVAANYSDVYEQPNGRLLLVKQNGRKKYTSVELQKLSNQFYGVTTWFLEDKKPKGKPYEKRGKRKLLLHVPRATDAGTSDPFVDANNEDRDDANWRRGQSSSEDTISSLANEVKGEKSLNNTPDASAASAPSGVTSSDLPSVGTETASLEKEGPVGQPKKRSGPTGKDAYKNAIAEARRLGEESPGGDVAKLRNKVLRAIPGKYGGFEIDRITQAIHEGQYEATRKRAVELPVPVRESDISTQLAEDAFKGTSHTPERRAKSVVRSYVSSMVDAWDKAAEHAKTNEDKQRLIDQFRIFKGGYVSRLNNYLSSHGRVMSSFIVGPAKFPTRANEKKSLAADKRFNDLLEWEKKGVSRLIKASQGPIDRSPSSELEVAKRKLENAEKSQVIMKEANRIIRKKSLSDDEKIKQIIAAGVPEKGAAELLKPDFMGKIGFASYSLTNNNAEIKRLRQRVAELQEKAEHAASDEPVKEISFEGGVVELDYPDNFLRIRHDEKPSVEIRQELKSNGFRWSPGDVAWRRKLTDNAIATAERITGATIKTKETDKGVALYSRTSTRPWPEGFPKAYAHTTVKKVTEHQDFKAAKSGDYEAAKRLVDDLMKEDRVKALVEKYPDAIAVPVLEQEESGVNMIPLAIVHKLAQHGMKLTDKVYQIGGSKRKGLDAVKRLLSRKVFDGKVTKGAQYILVDDVLTQGGTMHELRHYIANNGADAAGVVSLAFSAGSNIIAIKDSTVSALTERFGREQLESTLQKYDVSGTVEALTESEGRAILRFKSLEALRSRLAQEGSAGLHSRIPAGREASDRLKTGTTTKQVESESRAFLGQGFDNLVKRGKLRVVQSENELPDGGRPMRVESLVDAGLYKDGIIHLVADSIRPGDAEYLLRHEGLHMLMHEDKPFVSKQNEILDRFDKLKKFDKRIQSAFKRVPKDTDPEYVRQEALAYFVQDKANHATGIVKNVIANVRAWLIRHGVPLKNWSTDDMIALVTQGIKSYAKRAGSEKVASPALYSVADTINTAEPADIAYSSDGPMLRNPPTSTPFTPSNPTAA